MKPQPVLAVGVIYAADNGRLVCLECAGMMAKYSGRDISGQKVLPMGESDNEYWKREFDTPLQCESGCTQYK